MFSPLPPFPAEPHPSEVVPFDKSTMKELAVSLVAKAREDQIKMPTDESEARQRAGAVIVSNVNQAEKTVDLGACLDELQKTLGTKKNQKTAECAVEANRPLMEAFAELSGFEFKASNTMKGIAYRKVSTALATCGAVITDGKMATKLDGIGKSSAAKIDEFLSGGTIEKLEEYRSGALG